MPIESMLPIVFIDSVSIEEEIVNVGAAILENEKASFKELLESFSKDYNKVFCTYIVAFKGNYEDSNFNEEEFKKSVIMGNYNQQSVMIAKYSFDDYSKTKSIVKGEAGEKYKINYLSHNFFMKVENDLTIFSFSYLNLNEILASGDITAPPVFEASSAGPISTLIAVRNGETVAEEVKYVDGEGNDVHGQTSNHDFSKLTYEQKKDFIEQETSKELSDSTRREIESAIQSYNQNYSGVISGLEYPAGSPVPPPSGLFLTEERQEVLNVSNFKIKQEIEKFKLDFNLIEKIPSPGIQRLGSQEHVKTTIKPSYTTELWMSRNPDNSYGISFILDSYEVLAENSFFSGLIKKMVKSRKADELFLNSNVLDVLDISIYRKKVKNEVGTSFPLSNDNIEQDRDAIPELVLDKGVKTKVMVEKGSKYGIPDNFLIMKFKDEDIKQKQSGYYQYSMRASLSDPIFRYMSGILTTLKNNLSKIENYLNLSSIAGGFKTTYNGLDSDSNHENRYIQKQDRAMTQAELEGHYDPIADRFTETWAENGIELFEKDIEPAINYYTNVSYLFTSFIKKEMANKDLFILTSPITGTPRGIMVLQDLYKNLISILSSLFKTKSNKNKDRAGSADPKKEKSKSNAPTRTFNIEVNFSKILNTQDKKLYGYDFLGVSDSQNEFNLNKFPTISASDWKRRLEKEEEKFSFDEDIATQFDPEMLTPYAMVSPENKIDFFKESSNSIKYYDTELKVVYSNKISEKENNINVYSSILDKNLVNADARHMESLFSSLTGFSTTFENKKLIDDLTNDSYMVSATDTLAVDSITSFDKVKKSFKQAPLGLNELELLTKVLELEIGDKMEEQSEKSLRSYLRLNKENMIKVQYLAGFEKSREKDFVKRPTWQNLTSIDDFNSEFVICRISKVSKNNNYDLPIYNKYFIIMGI